MLKKAYLFLCLICISSLGLAHSENAVEHYFEIAADTSAGYDPAAWMEVKIVTNEKSYILTFEYSANRQVHLFSLEEINMNQKGVIQVTEVQYKSLASGTIFTLPFSDIPGCRIEVSPKDSYPQSTISSLLLTYQSCGGLYVRPM
jgi:hypothetical protein